MYSKCMGDLRYAETAYGHPTKPNTRRSGTIYGKEKESTMSFVLS